MRDSLVFLFRLYWSPLRAMSEIIDRGRLLFGALAVLAVSLLVEAGSASLIYRAYLQQVKAGGVPGAQPGATSGLGWALASFSTGSTLGTVVGLAALYAPAVLLLITLLEPVGSFGVAFRRDFGPLLACTLMAWAAPHLPFALLGLVLAPVFGLLAALALWAAAALYFAVLMVLAVRTVFGASAASAVGAVTLGSLSFLLMPFLGLLASPLLLYVAYQYFRGELGDVTWSFGARQSFKRHLEAATLNPRDASAHYNLGILHQQRRQIPEAIARFTRAVEIDPGELDAHYQLGRIARAERRFEDAIRSFEAVVERDPGHASHELWREIGATYLESESWPNARWALEKYVEKRPHDPEGLVYLGEALLALGDQAGARERFDACVEAADTMPAYRRREVARWRKRAVQRLAASA